METNGEKQEKKIVLLNCVLSAEKNIKIRTQGGGTGKEGMYGGMQNLNILFIVPSTRSF
ncbi:MAG: hypothetical protein LBT05_07980 [Planctomycetaceae bacterium]|jgi:hypothetical protein|nr:hypothetical protein [Planctomycetaceae bacterium]